VPFASSDAGPITYTVTLKPDSAPPKVDPDLAILGAARSMGAACFTSIRDGSPTRSATIHVTVLPTGTVSRSEVSSNSTTEAWVLSCLESVGKNLHFADRPAGDLRTYDVDVTVVRNH
jgi:hypothetical protein